MRALGKLAPFALAATLAGCAAIPMKHSAEAGVRRTLDAQVAAWNAGDIPAFMKGYAPDDSLRFASGDQVRRGWKETLARYQRAYPNKAAMGALTFEDLEIRPLSRHWAEVFGRFRLKRGGGYADLTGLFTLLMEKRRGEWLVLHDHTSTE